MQNMMENMKKCSKCLEVKEVGDFRDILGRSKKNGQKTIRSENTCKICYNDCCRAYRVKNKEKVKEQNRKSYHLNKEKNKEVNKEVKKEKKRVYDAKYKLSDKGLISQKRGKDKWNANNSEKRSKTFQNMRDNLTDGIVRSYLKKHGGCPQELINNPEIIEIKRLIIQIKRLCKI